MGRNRVITTRVSPEAYKKMLQKCADGGCSPYEYFRHLVYADIRLNEAEPVPEIEAEPVPEPEEPDEEMKQTELVKNGRSDEGRIRITG